MSVIGMFGGLFESVAKVYLDNRRLVGLVGETRDYYVHCGAMPKGVPKLSVALRCEENDAHRLLENVMAKVKEFPRGKLPVGAIRYRLWGASVRLLDSLHGTVELLPNELAEKGDELIKAIQTSRGIEHAICNFMLGESGADEHISAAEYSIRLDKFLRDLKASFNAIAVGFELVEIGLNRLAAARRSRCACSKPRKRREVTDEMRIKNKDIADIRTEVKRRVKAKTKGGIATNMKDELALLYKDEAWSRRCRQWKLETLYNYIIRR